MAGPTKLEVQNSADSAVGLALTNRETEYFDNQIELRQEIINLNEINSIIYQPPDLPAIS